MKYETSFVVFPQDTNYMKQGCVFGGKVLSEMDVAAHKAAKLLTNDKGFPKLNMVTVGVDGVKFFQPAYIGDIVRITATVCNVGNKSIKVHVLVHRKDEEWGLDKSELMGEGYFTFCAIDMFNQPCRHGVEE